LSPDAFAKHKICQKYVCGQGSAPDPTGGAHSAPSAKFGGRFMAGDGKGRGEYMKGRERTGRKRRGEEGKERKGREKKGGGRRWQGRGRAPKTKTPKTKTPKTTYSRSLLIKATGNT